MTYAEAIILGIIQGLTEFLPVSSSGHLVLTEHFLTVSHTPVFFNIAVHGGTLLATLYFFRTPLLELIRHLSQKKQISIHILLLITIATIPAGTVGLLLNPYLEVIFGSLYFLGVGYLITAVLLYVLHTLSKNDETKQSTQIQPYQFEHLTLRQAVLIGILQAIALIPGVSRSGATISAGRTVGLTVGQAFNFSFLLSIPVILGALVLQLIDQPNLEYVPQSLVGGLTAALVGYFALTVLRHVLIQKKVIWFAVYCTFLALVSFMIFYTLERLGPLIT